MAYNSGYRSASPHQNFFPAQQNGMHHRENFQQNPQGAHSGSITVHNHIGGTHHIYNGPPPSNDPAHGFYLSTFDSLNPPMYEQYPYTPSHRPNYLIPQNHPYNYNYNYNYGWQAPSNHPYNHNNGWNRSYHRNNGWQAPQNPSYNHQTTQASGLDRPGRGMDGVRLSQAQPSIDPMVYSNQSRPQNTSSKSVPAHQGFAVTVPSTPETLHPIIPNPQKVQEGSSVLVPVPSQNLADTKFQSQQKGSRDHAVDMPTQNITSTVPMFLPAVEVFRKRDRGHISFYLYVRYLYMRY
jgi:hypothetical protein